MAIVGAFVLPHPPLIIPAVGRGRESEIQDTVDACQEVGRRVAALAPDTVVITSPHATLYRDYFQISPGRAARGSFAAFGAPQAAYRCAYDTAFVDALTRAAERCGLSAGTDYERDPRLDHGTMIALHFLQGAGADFKVVRIGLSGMGPAAHYQLGQLIQQVASELDRRVVLVASGDLSHKLVASGPYGFAPEGPVFDEQVCAALATGEIAELLAIDPALAERAAECGLRSFQIMVGAFDRTQVTSELLSHEGPFGVGYGVAALMPQGEVGADEGCDRLETWRARRAADLARRKEQEDAHVRLARASLEAWVRDGRRIAPADAGVDLTGELTDKRAGCFVSIKVDGQLRGCIGTIAPTRATLADEICANARSAATRDPRFEAVRTGELADLVYDVDVLGEPERISGPEELDPRRYGVIVSAAGGRRGLLLPDLDGVDTVEEQIEIASRKGHIDYGYEDVVLERFEVVRHL